MNEVKTSKTDTAAESVSMTYGMSDTLLQSGLLQRIDSLSTADKRCIISYIAQKVEKDSLEEDEWDRQDTSDLEPYTLDELYARIQESEDDIRNGRVLTEKEAREELKKEFLSRRSPDNLTGRIK
jgi:hypothetical protein